MTHVNLPYALILRLAAIQLTQESERGAYNLRRTLADLGWTDPAIDAAVARAIKAVMVLEQRSFLEAA